jgi:two-component system OmpR family response regulator
MENLPHILVVDDDPAITEMVGHYLSGHDLRVSVARSGLEMREVLRQTPVQLVLMDLRLKGENGLTLARELREQQALPVIILTGQSEEADRVMGLELAADDYVVKPFSLRELLARIRAVLRRYAVTGPGAAGPAAAVSGTAGAAATAATVTEAQPAVRAYRFDGWELNLGLRRLCAPGRVLSRDQLLEMTRYDASAVYDRAIDVQILRLRRKIEADPAEPRYIRTERGAGYVFATVVEALT